MRQIKDCLNPRLVDLCLRSTQLNTLETHCFEFIKPELRKHCQIGQFRQGRLVLMVADPVWATELRYELPALRDHLRKKAGLQHLSSIEVKIGVASEEPVSQKKIRRANPLSSAAKRAIASLAESCGYLPLKEALTKLAK